MKHRPWPAFITRLAYCIDRDLWKAIENLKEYYHHERIYQDLGKIIEPIHRGNTGNIICIERLGGLLKLYHRAAALEHIDAHVVEEGIRHFPDVAHPNAVARIPAG